MATEQCPECKKGELTAGYGLAGGGIGPYWMCSECDFFIKEQEDLTKKEEQEEETPK